MQNQLEYVLINEFKCKRCGCTKYDKMIYTGMKTLDNENAIVCEKYVCRNCDFPFDINDYSKEIIENLTITSSELLSQSEFVDEN